jgi:hypothetical protein
MGICKRRVNDFLLDGTKRYSIVEGMKDPGVLCTL